VKNKKGANKYWHHKERLISSNDREPKNVPSIDNTDSIATPSGQAPIRDNNTEDEDKDSIFEDKAGKGKLAVQSKLQATQYETPSQNRHDNDALATNQAASTTLLPKPGISNFFSFSFTSFVFHYFLYCFRKICYLPSNSLLINFFKISILYYKIFYLL